MYSHDLAQGIFIAARAFDHIAISQPDLVAGEKTKVAFLGHFHEIFLLYPQFAADRELTVATLGMMRMYRRAASFSVRLRKIINDEFEWIEYAHDPSRFFIQIVAQRTFQCTHVDPAIRFRNADALGK